MSLVQFQQVSAHAHREAIRAILTNTTNSTVHTNSTIVHNGPYVGSLPLVHFINTFIGCLVATFCLGLSIWFLQHIRRTEFLRREKTFKGFGPSAFWKKSKTIGPTFLRKEPPSSSGLSNMIKSDVSTRKSSLKSDSSGYSEESTISPDLPIPVPQSKEEIQDDSSDTTLKEILECENLVKERLKVDVLIVNLKRVDQAKRAAGGIVQSSPVGAAVEKRRNLETAIQSKLQKLQEGQETMTEEERGLLNQISSLIST